MEKRAAIFIAPELGTVQRADLAEAAREAADAGFDALIACAFNFEAHTTEFAGLGNVPLCRHCRLPSPTAGVDGRNTTLQAARIKDW